MKIPPVCPAGKNGAAREGGGVGVVAGFGW